MPSDESNATPAKVDAKKEETPPSYNLSKFRLQKILHNNTSQKRISLLGSFPDVSAEESAIVIFEKHAFRETDVATNGAASEEIEAAAEGAAEAGVAGKPSYFNNELKVRADFVNNIYKSYHCVPTSELCGVKGTVIYPATEKHIEKYSICQKYIIQETPELYQTVTVPYIESSQFSLEWVYNILEHKQETERIVFEDDDPENGFILLPDLKWDGQNPENLYLLGIVHKHGIKSLRDLNGSHLPMLKNLRKRSVEAISKRYGYHGTQLRMYFHYQPSFYHLHVHINPVRNDAPGIWCEKSHMLDTVINNLELVPDYYQRSTLPFVLYEGNKLLDMYEEKLAVRKPKAIVEQQEEEKEKLIDEESEPATKRPKLDEESNEKTAAAEAV